MADIRVRGAADEQLAGELAIRAGGRRAVEAEEPLVDQVRQLGRRRTDAEIAERLALIGGVGRATEHDVLGEAFDVVRTGEEGRRVDDVRQVRELGAVDSAVVAGAGEKGHDVGATQGVIGVKRAAECAEGGVSDVSVEPVGRLRRSRDHRSHGHAVERGGGARSGDLEGIAQAAHRDFAAGLEADPLGPHAGVDCHGNTERLVAAIGDAVEGHCISAVLKMDDDRLHIRRSPAADDTFDGNDVVAADKLQVVGGVCAGHREDASAEEGGDLVREILHDSIDFDGAVGGDFDRVIGTGKGEISAIGLLESFVARAGDDGYAFRERLVAAIANAAERNEIVTTAEVDRD